MGPETENKEKNIKTDITAIICSSHLNKGAENLRQQNRKA